MSRAYDAIVVGLGGMGSAALSALANRGHRVLGLDANPIGHDRGSSHGESRIIRKAYFEHPNYVPLLQQAYADWAALEDRCGVELFRKVGLLQAGPADGTLISGVRESARVHQLELQNVPRAELSDRFASFRFADDWETVFESDAGVLRVEDCVRAHVQSAQRCGAEIRTGFGVSGWRANADGVEAFAGDSFCAKSLVICGGAWSSRILADLDLPLSVLRKVVGWYRWVDPSQVGARIGGNAAETLGTPAFCFDTRAGFFYGCPGLIEPSMKMGQHSGGDVVSDVERIRRIVCDADLRAVNQFAASFVPMVDPHPIRTSVCMYTMTPDEHFIVDQHPQHENVFFACGFSGHGFKFAPVIAAALADFVESGRTSLPIGFLGLGRPALQRSGGA